MALVLDISVLGRKDLERALSRLESRTQKKVLRQALRKSAKRTQARVVDNLSGEKVGVITGQLREAFKKSKIRGATRRGTIRIGVEFPTRDALGIAADDPHYYPTAVEFGHGNVPPYPYMRPAVDEHRTKEIAEIGRDVGKGIEREAGK